MRRVAAACAVWLLPAALWACEAITSGQGLPGRFAEVDVINSKPGGGRLEGWAPRGARLIMHAGFDKLTSAYGHNILGSVRDAKHLAIHLRLPGDTRKTCPKGVALPDGEVFEDIAPRLVDVTGDGLPEVIVVQSNAQLGARVVIYDRQGRLVAANSHIGTRFRWLAPIGIADLDGDGHVEIAYIDRPHLAKTLRVLRFQNGTLREVAQAKGFTNHRIAERDIAGGIRTCNGTPEMIVATADWARLNAVTFAGGTLQTHDIGPHKGRQSFTVAMKCG